MYILIDNYDSFTYNVYQYLCELTDKEIRVARNDEITLAEIEKLAPEGIIISPGPGRPEDAGITVAAIRHFAGRVPILGVCLGHQAIGAAFGAKVVQAQRIVHGKSEEIRLDGRGLFRYLPQRVTFARYHSLAVEEKSLPPELEVTAWATDGEVMGLRHKTHLIEGVQFHPESVGSEYGKELLRNFLEYAREPYPIKANLLKLLDGKDLTRSEAGGFMDELTAGKLSEVQIAAYLTALAAKGPTPDEIAGCADVLLRKRLPLKKNFPALDTCGTGGDELGTFNISSLAAIVAAAAGAKVAKHGNRAASSKSGSADYYAELGIPIDLGPDDALAMIRETGFAFLFAQKYHGAMKHAGPVRRMLGIKTIMNVLGPLVNPAEAEYRLIGVYSDALCRIEARAAKLLGVKRIMTAHGNDGLDEISVTGPTRIVFIDEKGKESDFVFSPADIGLPLHPLSALAGGSARENVFMTDDLLSGKGNPAIRQAVLLNAGAALFVAGLAGMNPAGMAVNGGAGTEGIKAGIADGYAKAEAALASGGVAAKLAEIRNMASSILSKKGDAA